MISGQLRDSGSELYPIPRGGGYGSIRHDFGSMSSLALYCGIPIFFVPFGE